MNDLPQDPETRGIVGARMPAELKITNTNMAATWKLWKQRYEWYATAVNLNIKPAEMQAATLMMAMGEEAAVIFNTFNMAEVERNNVAEIKKRFDDYFAPQANETYTRWQFNQYMQHENESFDNFLTELRTRMRDCNFGEQANSLLRDKIVQGIRSDKIRELLLQETKLELEKAIQICKASENATAQLKEMQNRPDNTDKEVLTVATGTRNKRIVDTRSRERATNQEHQTKIESKLCGRCGVSHKPRQCPAADAQCYECNKKGHYARKCERRRQRGRMQELGTEDVSQEANEYDVDTLYMSEIIDTTGDLQNENKPWYIRVQFPNGEAQNFKIDTGADGNVMSKACADKLQLKITASKMKRVRSFNHGYTAVVGEVITTCAVKNHRAKVRIMIVEGNYSALLGRATCEKLKLVTRIEAVEIDTPMKEEIFRGVGCITQFEYDIELKEGSEFKIHPPRTIPYAIRSEVKRELDKMQKMGIIKPVTHPTPAVCPLVVVVKDKKVRLCLDPSDINKAVQRRQFPLKTVEDIAARIGKAKYFTLLDARKGFWQIKVTKRTSDYLTVNTPWGRYSFLRLPFGLASAPEVYQQLMQSILHDIKQTECSMDDILIWANTEEELHTITNQVMNRLFSRGIRLNKEKCLFQKKTIKFLGHIFTEGGIEIDPEKVEAINQIETPKTVKELQRILGMANYIAKFLPNYSNDTEPLRRLLIKDVAWEWTAVQDEALSKLKESMKNTTKLAFYNVNKPIRLSVDASTYAVGAVLLQEGRPVAYSTKALTETQQRYPQIEKEAFAMRHGCLRFHDYIYGLPLTIETDHKPLQAISKKPLASAPPRLQRIMFDVLQYAPTVLYKKGTEIPIADALSRNCTQKSINTVEEFEIPLDVPLPAMKLQELQEATTTDQELNQLRNVVTTGWPEDKKQVPYQLLKYWTFREEISVYEMVLFKNTKLIVPSSLRKKYLDMVHKGHLGIAATINRARSTLYWENLKKDVEQMVKTCTICETTSRKPNMEPMIMKPVPRYPWQRVASDLFHVGINTYVLVADSYSGFYTFEQIRDQSSRSVIKFLKREFATHGIPDVIETDNGPQYDSVEFKEFCKTWKIYHQTSTPYYPRSNGLAERYVQEAKKLIRKCRVDNTDIQLALLNWRNTPRNTLGSPAQRLFNRQTNTQLLMHPTLREPQLGPVPNVATNLRKLRETQKQQADPKQKARKEIPEGTPVRVRTGNRHWEPATLIKQLPSPRSFMIRTQQGKTARKNSSTVVPTLANIPEKIECAVRPEPVTRESIQQEPNGQFETQPANRRQTVKLANPTSQNQAPITTNQVPMTTRSGRAIRPPNRLNL